MPSWLAVAGFSTTRGTDVRTQQFGRGDRNAAIVQLCHRHSQPLVFIRAEGFRESFPRLQERCKAK